MPARKNVPPAPDPSGDLPGRDNAALAASVRNPLLSRTFLPSVDLVDTDPKTLSALTDGDKQQVLETKLADITHFRVGLGTLHRTARVALDLITETRVLPKQVRALVRNADGSPASRVSVQPSLPNSSTVLGRGVVTDALGLFTLPLDEVTIAQRRIVLRDGFGLRFTGAGNAVSTLVVAVPPFGRQALGELRLRDNLRPLPDSIVGALIDLVGDLDGAEPEPGFDAPANAPIQVQLGQDACNITFEEDAVVRRFPYKMLVRLVEPRTTTVNRVYVPRRPGTSATTGKQFLVPAFNANLIAALGQTDTRFVERLPVDKPISVDGFRDQMIGVSANRIGDERTIPMAGTLGLGYVLNMQQVWKYRGLTLGNLLYSLPLAPGEQQRIAVSERVATASVRESERLDITERQHAALREDASTQAVFDSAFEEHVLASSSYRNSARSSSWGVAGGIGAVLGPVAIGIGAGGGGGKSSNNGSTQSALDGARSYTSSAAEDMHRSVEREAAARRTAQRSSIRLATERDRETVTTKVISNHNKMHALTIQYWEVLRKFVSTTEVNGVSLVCFVPLDLVRFLPAGQLLELTDTLGVDTRAELLLRYALLHKHSDAIQRGLPQRHREGLRLLSDFAANPRATVNVAAPAANTLSFTLVGRYIPYERLWVRVQLRGGRQLGPLALDSVLTAIPSGSFGTRTELLSELKRLRSEGAEVSMTGSLLLPESVDPSEIVAFEIRRSFTTIDFQLDPSQNPLYQALQALDNLPFTDVDLSAFESSARFTTAELERELGGPFVRNFSVRLNGGADSLAADSIGSSVELPPGAYPVAALERNPILGFRDVMKIERTLQHVVQNTLTYSKAVWASLTPEERILMLEGYTIGLPEEGLDADGFTDASQHVPLLNCVANQVVGYYGNCMVMPFSIPPSLAVALNGDPNAEDAASRAPLTNAAVQEALTTFHREAFAPPESHFTLPTRGVLGEAVLGHCSAAEKIDLTRFWNWQDSPGDEATAIEGVTLRPNSVASLSAPSTLANTPSIVNNVAGEGGTSGLGALAQALAGKGPAGTDFSTDFLGQDVLKTLGGKTIDSAEAARKDALASATTLATKALDAGVDVYKTKFGADKAADAKKAAEAKAATGKEGDAAKAAAAQQDAAVKTLRENATSFLGVAESKAADPLVASTFASDIITGLAGGPLPAAKAATLFSAFDEKKEGAPTERTAGSTAWLTALGLL
jgi:hypothetical protein